MHSLVRHILPQITSQSDFVTEILRSEPVAQSELARVSQDIPASSAHFRNRLQQFSATQAISSSSPDVGPKPSEPLREWLNSVDSDVRTCGKYLNKRNGAELGLEDAKDLRDILQRLREELYCNLLDDDSPYAHSWPDEHQGLRSDTADLHDRWKNVIDAVNPYFLLLRFKSDNPGVGMDDLSKARQHFLEIQDDTRKIIERFDGYSKVLLPLVTQVLGKLPK